MDPDSIKKEIGRLEREGKRTADYKETVVYAAFYWSSDAATRELLKREGLDKSGNDHGIVRSNRNESDPGESNSSRTDSLTFMEEESNEIRERMSGDSNAEMIQEIIQEKVDAEVSLQVGIAIQKIVGVFLSTPNAKVSAGGLAFAAGLSALNGLNSQTAYAKRIGLTKSAISKSVRFWKHLLDLPENPHMKTEKACSSYSSAQTQNHWRNKKYGDNRQQDKDKQ